MGFFDYLFAIGVLALICLLAYLSTRFVASRATAAGRGGRSANMRVVDRLYLAKDKQLIIVLVGGQALLLGLAVSEITVLERLDLGELEIPGERADAAELVSLKFADILKSAGEKLKAGKNGRPWGKTVDFDPETGDFETEPEGDKRSGDEGND